MNTPFLLRRWKIVAVAWFVPLLLVMLVFVVRTTEAQGPPMLSGVVVSPTGLPLSGGDVDVFVSKVGPQGEAIVVTRTVASPPTYSFTLEIGGLPGAGIYIIRAAPAEGSSISFFPSVPITRDIDMVTSVDLGNVRLTYPSFEGIVYDSQGNPALGGWVGVYRMIEGGKQEVARGAVNLDGSYAVGGVPAGDELLLIAFPPLDSLDSASSPKMVAVAEGSQYDPDMTQTKNLYLEGPNLVGQAVYPNGQPVAWIMNPADPDMLLGGASAVAASWDQGVRIDRMTARDGNFGMHVPDGVFEIWIEPRGTLAFTYTKSLAKRVVMQEESGGGGNVPATMVEVGPLTLTFPSFVGQVLMPDGSPLNQGECVEVWLETMTGVREAEFMYCGNMPRYTLGGIPAGDYYLKTTGLPSAGIAAAEPVPVHVNPGTQYDPDSTQVINLALRAANVYGRILLPQNHPYCPNCPVPDSEVILHTEDWAFEQHVWTDGNGVFAFADIQPGEYVLDARPPEWMYPMVMPAEPHFFTLTDTYGVELYLRWERPIAEISGQVSKPDGTPVHDGQVFAAKEDGGGWIQVPLGDDGRYALRLPHGLWRVGVTPNPGADWYLMPDDERWFWFPYTMTVPVTETADFVVHLFSEGEYFKVSGVLTTATGVPLGSAVEVVELCNDEGECYGNAPDAEGRFFIWAEPGPYYFWVRLDPDSPFAPPPENGTPVFVDQDMDLGVFVLPVVGERTARVSGRVIITPTGEGAPGILVEAWTEEGDFNATQTISDGTYTLELFPGYWRGGPVLPLPEEYSDYILLPPHQREGMLAPGDELQNVNFYLKPYNAAIAGTVVDGAGNIITDDVEIRIFADACTEWGCGNVSGDEVWNGRFHMGVLGGYTYTIHLWVAEGQFMPPAPLEVYVDISETKSITLTVMRAGTLIWGGLMSNIPDDDPRIDATVFGTSQEGYWVEDQLWPEKDPYQYYLHVPTPVSEPMTWTLDLYVDPATGYVPDPAHPMYEVVVQPGQKFVRHDLYVKKLSLKIIGWVGVLDGTLLRPLPFVTVYADGVGGTTSEDLHFETRADARGVFTMPVVAGTFQVGAYLPPRLEDRFLPPIPVEWNSMDDNPIRLIFRPRPPAAEAVGIHGTIAISPANALANGTGPVHVLGWSEEGGHAEVTATVGNMYHLPVISNTTWYLWAVYEDEANNKFYQSREIRVPVGLRSVQGITLTLEPSQFELPDGRCWTVGSNAQRLELPGRGDVLPPLIEIQAGTFSGTVKICATPAVAVPEGQRIVGFAYELRAWDDNGKLITSNFNKKLRLIFYFSRDALRNVPSYPYPQAGDLRPVYFSTVRNDWVPLDDPFVDEEDMFATGKIDHFTKMGILAEPQAVYYLYLPLILKGG